MIQENPLDRLAFDGNVEDVLVRATEWYGVGDFVGMAVDQVGREDFNAYVATDQGEYFAKIFADWRFQEEPQRYVDITQGMIDAGVRHPALQSHEDGRALYTDGPSSLQMVLMDYIPGKTLYDDGYRQPTADELGQILEQAVLIHGVPDPPPPISLEHTADSLSDAYWSISPVLPMGMLGFLAHAVAEYQLIDLDALPHCLVHNDLTKANIKIPDSGEVYILDTSYAAEYPRIKELAVMAAYLFNDEAEACPMAEVFEKLVVGYVAAGGELTVPEVSALPIFTQSILANDLMRTARQVLTKHNDDPALHSRMDRMLNGLRRIYT